MYLSQHGNNIPCIDSCFFGFAGLVSRHPHTTNVRALFYSGVLDTPAAAISLRAIDPERYAIVNEEDGDVIEEIEESKAFYEVYDGAVYMFQAGPWPQLPSQLCLSSP